MGRTITIDWEPQARQLVCLQACGLDFPFTGQPLRPAIADVIGYGGAAGGGKTDTLLQIGIIAAVHYPKIQIAYFRREFPQLEGLGGAISRSKELLGHFLRYNEQKHKWTFPFASALQFFHCKDPNDIFNYQSQQFDILLADESTQFTEEMLDYLITRNRKTIDDERFKPFTALATNPGNIGHNSFKERFITIGQPERLHEYQYPTGVIRLHYFIPSKLTDNKILMERDPGYSDRISTSEMNKKMLLDGEWDVFIGQAFGELRRNTHIIDPFEFPPHTETFGAYDHGFNHPFSFGIFKVDADGNVYLVKHAKQRLKRPDEIAQVMDTLAGGIHNLSYIVAGHDCWTTQRDGGPTIAEQFMNTSPKIFLRQASIDRVQGVNQVRAYLAWKNRVRDKDGNTKDGTPRFYIFSNCSSVYDTLAGMVFDENKPEDVKKVDADENGKGGDDDYDMVRYGLMSRPKPLPQIEVKPPPNSFEAYMRKKQEEKWLKEEYVGWS